LSVLIGFGGIVEAFGLLDGCGSCGEVAFAFESICVGGHGVGFWTVVGMLRNWVLDVRNKCWMFVDVISEHGQKIVVEPLSTIQKVCLGHDHQKFSHITCRFNGVAPRSVKEDVANGFLGSFGDQVVCINFQIEHFCGRSDNRDCGC